MRYESRLGLTFCFNDDIYGHQPLSRLPLYEGLQREQASHARITPDWREETHFVETIVYFCGASLDVWQCFKGHVGEKGENQKAVSDSAAERASTRCNWIDKDELLIAGQSREFINLVLIEIDPTRIPEMLTNLFR